MAADGSEDVLAGSDAQEEDGVDWGGDEENDAACSEESKEQQDQAEDKKSPALEDQSGKESEADQKEAEHKDSDEESEEAKEEDGKVPWKVDTAPTEVSTSIVSEAANSKEAELPRKSALTPGSLSLEELFPPRCEDEGDAVIVLSAEDASNVPARSSAWDCSPEEMSIAASFGRSGGSLASSGNAVSSVPERRRSLEQAPSIRLWSSGALTGETFGHSPYKVYRVASRKRSAERPKLVVWLHALDFEDIPETKLLCMFEHIGCHEVYFLVPLNPKGGSSGLRFLWGVSYSKAQNRNNLAFVFGELHRPYLDDLCALIRKVSFEVKAIAVWCMGYSLGGFGAYQLAAHDPATFTGAAAVAGHALGTLEPEHRGYGAPQPEASRIFETWLDYSAPRLAKVPALVVIHSERDTVSSILDARAIVDRVRTCGGNAELVYVPEDVSDSRPGTKGRKSGHQYCNYAFFGSSSRAVLYSRLETKVIPVRQLEAKKKPRRAETPQSLVRSGMDERLGDSSSGGSCSSSSAGAATTPGTGTANNSNSVSSEAVNGSAMAAADSAQAKQTLPSSNVQSAEASIAAPEKPRPQVKRMPQRPRPPGPAAAAPAKDVTAEASASGSAAAPMNDTITPSVQVDTESSSVNAATETAEAAPSVQHPKAEADAQTNNKVSEPEDAEPKRWGWRNRKRGSEGDASNSRKRSRSKGGGSEVSPGAATAMHLRSAEDGNGSADGIPARPSRKTREPPGTIARAVSQRLRGLREGDRDGEDDDAIEEVFVGHVVSFAQSKGIGWITCTETFQRCGNDIFFHRSHVRGADQLELAKGNLVRFTVAFDSNRRPEARNVEKCVVTMFKGIIKSYLPEKGYGFLVCEDARFKYKGDVFFHKSHVEGERVETGDTVTFALDPCIAGKPKALNVAKEKNEEAATEPQDAQSTPLASGGALSTEGDTPGSREISAYDLQGRPYDLSRVVVNFVNVGYRFGEIVLKRDSSARRFDYEGVRRCVQHLTQARGLLVIGVVYENFKGVDAAGNAEWAVPYDIEQMCESIELTPRVTGQNQRNAHDEMTIKCAYRRNCRFLDNNNYKTWLNMMTDETIRTWLRRCQGFLQMRFFFDAGLGTFDTLDGNVEQLAPLAESAAISASSQAEEACQDALTEEQKQHGDSQAPESTAAGDVQDMEAEEEQQSVHETLEAASSCNAEEAEAAEEVITDLEIRSSLAQAFMSAFDELPGES
eukprot:TRINITY_DN36372_c0_g1_i2.p1 TRINITY_DN36372_c0_g1~~TRINITY_DN36372_c0_g1_i2.p1  ORF type:complete len:1223 (+),score=250.52 TRINITY_DN36372_c0_g1_i2:26-3694(+)